MDRSYISGVSQSKFRVGAISPSLSALSADGKDDFDFNLSSPRRKDVSHLPPLTKIVCTLGPSSKDPSIFAQMCEAGMNVVRLNFSHGTHQEHAELLQTVRGVLSRTRRIVSFMLDTKGPEIRIGLLKDGKDVDLVKGQEFTFTTDQSVQGDNTIASVTYDRLPQIVQPGKIILLDDGNIGMKVKRIGQDGKTVVCEVLNKSVLSQRKKVNLPGTEVDLPAVTEQDVEDIKFGVEHHVDFIAASFVRRAEDIEKIRTVLGKAGQHIRIIAKIESKEGIDNFDQILRAADGIMVARGDLGVEIPIEEVALAQKMMISKCNMAGKPVITATQMLESMIKNPSPTRAEATDVANAVFDGTDAVMLSGETAKGKYPVEVVTTMANICREAEAHSASFARSRLENLPRGVSISEAIAFSAVKAAFAIDAALIIVLTETGRTSSLVAKYRPDTPILSITANEIVARQMLVVRGCYPLLVGSMIGTDSLIHRCTAAAKKLNMCKVNDNVVITSGAKEAVAGATNILKIVQVTY